MGEGAYFRRFCSVENDGTERRRRRVDIARGQRNQRSQWKGRLRGFLRPRRRPAAGTEYEEQCEGRARGEPVPHGAAADRTRVALAARTSTTCFDSRPPVSTTTSW